MIAAGIMLDRNHRLAGLALLLGASLWAQEPTATYSTRNSSAQSAQEPLSPLHLGLPKSPVALFRTLLAMSPQERQSFLASRSPEAQKLILAKIREYTSLTPEQRELRLRVTELRWYLLPLLNVPATNRLDQLNSVPPEIRGLIQERLEHWDKLSPSAQKQMLENESIVSFYSEQAAPRPERNPASVPGVSDATRQQFEAGIRHWQGLPPEQRQEIVSHFNEFFQLTSAEQEKTLRTLSETERLQIEKTLHTFEGLTPAQRSQCLRSFQKFASLSPDERRQFLKNAERWELMSPSERQSWRSLVSTLSQQPPLPPGFNSPAAPQPPLPKTAAPTGPSLNWATNSN